MIASKPLVVHIIHLCFALFEISPISLSIIFVFQGTFLPSITNLAKVTMKLEYFLLKSTALTQPDLYKSSDILLSPSTVQIPT